MFPTFIAAGLPLLAVASPPILPGRTATAGEYLVVSGGSDPDSNSVAVYDLFPNDKIWLHDEVPVKGMALWMQIARNPSDKMVAFGVGHTKSWSAGFVSEWVLESAKDWRPAGTVPAGGAGDCHFLLSANKQYGYVAGYNTGEWHMIDLYGSLDGAKVTKTIKFPACPNTNNTLIAPKPGVAREHETVSGGRYWVDGQYQKEMLYIMDVGCDVIHRVGVEEDGSFYKRYPDLKVPCRGPRHMAMHPVFDDLGAIVCEEEDVVLLVNFHLPQDGGYDAEPDWLKKLPLSGFANTRNAIHHGAAILWHPNGNFLYASQRTNIPGDGRIATYKLNPIGSIFTWEFTRIQNFKPAGNWPRGVAIHPKGFLMAVADMHAQTLQIVDVDENTGLLSDCANGMQCIYNTSVTQPTHVEFFHY